MLAYESLGLAVCAATALAWIFGLHPTATVGLLLLLLGLLALLGVRASRGTVRRKTPQSPLDQLVGGLSKTRARLGLAIRRALGQELTESAVEELEVAMLEADMGVAVTTALLEDLRTAYREKKAEKPEELLSYLQHDLHQSLKKRGNSLAKAPSGPTVVLVVGVNGVGKTTSIAKLALLLKTQGKKVLLCAADTFRAAAVEQLTIWAERTGVRIVKGATGADPASVAHDAAEACIARNVDYLIVDTAGRLHTAKNLMAELAKIKRVLKKKIPKAPHEVLLVLDATLGQNAIAQARTFQEVTDVTGLFLAKLDGTAKGGVIVAIDKELEIPVKFVGLGEQPEDVQPFDAERFVKALFA
ncbi:signal recognition particle-docking protein FtsY [Planctomycetota bacterium]